MEVTLSWLKDTLHHHARECEKIADKLSTEGKPLTDRDISNIKVAISPDIKMNFDIAHSYFIIGDNSTMKYHLNAAKDIMYYVDSFEKGEG